MHEVWRDQFGDLFTARQKLALVAHLGLSGGQFTESEIRYARGLAIAIAHRSAKSSIQTLSIYTWQIDPGMPRASLSHVKHFPTTWDFAEDLPPSGIGWVNRLIGYRINS